MSPTSFFRKWGRKARIQPEDSLPGNAREEPTAARSSCSSASRIPIQPVPSEPFEMSLAFDALLELYSEDDDVVSTASDHDIRPEQSSNSRHVTGEQQRFAHSKPPRCLFGDKPLPSPPSLVHSAGHPVSRGPPFGGSNVDLYSIQNETRFVGQSLGSPKGLPRPGPSGFTRTSSAPNVQCSHSHRLPSPISSKRSMPHLDRVWKGFLNDVEPDIAAFQDVAIATPNHRRFERGLEYQINGHHLNDDTSCGSRSRAFPLNASPAMKPPTSPRSYTTDSVDPCQAVSLEVSLSSFPVPPPLFIRRKVSKQLGIMPNLSVGTLHSFTSVSSSGYSTPIATPATPRSPGSNCPTPPSSPRKSPPYSFHILPPRRSPPMSPLPEPPQFEEPSWLGPSNGRAPSQSLTIRPTHSVPDLQVEFRTNVHRVTSSDSTSSSTQPRPGRITKPRTPLMEADPSYLKSRGRVVKPCPSLEPHVHWGYAL